MGDLVMVGAVVAFLLFAGWLGDRPLPSLREEKKRRPRRG